jgi:hypothetical protein
MALGSVYVWNTKLIKVPTTGVITPGTHLPFFIVASPFFLGATISHSATA